MLKVRHLILSRKLGVDELDIKSAEEKLGVIFPEQYKELYKKHLHSYKTLDY